MTLNELARRIGATVVGNGEITVRGCAGIDRAKDDELTFLANPKYRQFLETTHAAAVVMRNGTTCPDRITRLEANDPYFAFRNAMVELHGYRRHPEPTDETERGGSVISTLAFVHPQASIGADSRIHPFAVVEAGAVIGRNCVLYSGAYVGMEASLGEECVLYPNAVVYDRCVLGNRVTLHSNAVIGQDGFGYATHQGEHHKIPQAGIVVIEDDVEIGAGCAIERATVGDTRIGRGCKFADLISIGHGTQIGTNCLFVSLIGVSGSVEIGDQVVLGGQVGVAGHLRIGHGVQAAGRTVIAQDIPDGLKVGGTPAIPIEQAKRNALAATELYDLFKRVRLLERELDHLKKNCPSE